MTVSFGFDTSNYTTSAAVYRTADGSYVNSRRILSVEDGNVGLRQSEALFKHIKNLPEIVRNAAENCDNIDCIGVSTRPRAVEGSYMPCFLAGVASAETAASTLKVPLYRFSHQAGHIAAALLSSGHTELLCKEFISFHVSGGTTEALLVSRDDKDVFKTELVGSSLDLKMGQAVDRIGNMLGLSFPAGKELDKLAVNGVSPVKVRPVLKDCDCSISGLQNRAEALLKKGCSPEDIARFTIDTLCETLSLMTERLLCRFPGLPVVFAGGVMSNSIISRVLTERFGAFFASPELSSDNAVGIAFLAAYLHESRKD